MDIWDMLDILGHPVLVFVIVYLLFKFFYFLLGSGDHASREPDAADERSPSQPEIAQVSPSSEPDAADERSPSEPKIVQVSSGIESEHVGQLFSKEAMFLALKMISADGNDDERKLAIIANLSRADVEVPIAVEASPIDIAKAMINAPENEKVEALYLCVRIAEVDSEISEEEKDLIDKAAKAMRVDVHKFTMMRQDLKTKACAIAEVLIGIQPNWSEDKKKDHAEKEYEKWQPRANRNIKEAEDKVMLISFSSAQLKRRKQGMS